MPTPKQKKSPQSKSSLHNQIVAQAHVVREKWTANKEQKTRASKLEYDVAVVKLNSLSKELANHDAGSVQKQ